MKPAAVITTHVINTLNALPTEERSAITSALAAELLLGEDMTETSLTPMQAMIYSMIRSYIRRDTIRYSGLHPQDRSCHDDPFRRQPSSTPLTAGVV